VSSDEIVAALTRVQKSPPVEALRAADAHRAELTPRLITCLAEVVTRPGILAEDGELQLPFFAMYLLASWREAAAHPLLLAFLRLPGEQCLDLSGDIVTEDMDRMLAQTAGGNPDGLLALARDPAVNEWSRVAAINALALLAAWGELPRATLIAHYRELIAAAGPPQKINDPGPVLANYVSSALDLGLVEMRDELLQLMDRGWIEEGIVGSRDDVAAEFDRPNVIPIPRPIDDVVEAIRWWGCFAREPGTVRFPAAPVTPLEPERPSVIPQPYRAPPKVGRNDPCPCGSGKKYKKCCGA
jgi:hypothetical protein